MRTTTTISSNEHKGEKRPGIFRRVFGGEFLLSRQMRPWYPYIALIFILVACLVISEQSILEKKARISDLEDKYKNEIQQLKSNNQFIPYEENQQLIQKMQARGYVLDEEHTYIITVKEQDNSPKHHFFQKPNTK